MLDDTGGSADDRDDAVRLVTVDEAWARRYLEVGSHLVAQLGDAFSDAQGELSELHHVGSTAVPGMPAKPTLDVMGRLVRWPLAEPAAARLRRAGWRDHGEHGLPGRRYFTRGRHEAHLHLVAPDAPHLARHLAFRDLLRSDAAARKRYGHAKATLVARHRGARAAYVTGKDAPVRELEAAALAAAPARLGFGPLVRVVATLPRDARNETGRSPGAARRREPRRWPRDRPRCPWAIGGGWALDLAAGAGPDRLHEDVDLVLDRTTAPATLAAAEAGGIRWRLLEAGRARSWRGEDRLPATAHRLEGRLGSVLAGADAEGGGDRPVFVDAVLEPRSPHAWRLRTAPALQYPLERAITRVALRDPRGDGPTDVPILAPEVVLLSKACLSGRASPTAKDVQDAVRHLPRLDPSSRRWLRDALASTAGEAWAALLQRSETD